MRTWTESEQLSAKNLLFTKHLQIQNHTIGFQTTANNAFILDFSAENRMFVQVLLCDKSENLDIRIKSEIKSAKLAMKLNHCKNLSLLALDFDLDGHIVRNEFFCF